MEIADLILIPSMIIGGVAVLIFVGCVITNNLNDD
jgi:hypothetical protein